MLEPDAVIHIDAAARIDAPPSEVGKPRELRGAAMWAKQFIAHASRMRSVELAILNGSVGLIVAPRGRLDRVLVFTFAGGGIARVEVVADRARLRGVLVAGV